MGSKVANDVLTRAVPVKFGKPGMMLRSNGPGVGNGTPEKSLKLSAELNGVMPFVMAIVCPAMKGLGALRNASTSTVVKRATLGFTAPNVGSANGSRDGRGSDDNLPS